MFSQKHRLGKTTEVRMVLAKGRAFFNALLTIKFLPRPGALPRFTVVVSTKVSKSAVKRNRIKRVLREFIRLNLAGFLPGDYMVMVKPQAAQKESADLIRGMTEVCRKFKLAKLL